MHVSIKQSTSCMARLEFQTLCREATRPLQSARAFNLGLYGVALFDAVTLKTYWLFAGERQHFLSVQDEDAAIGRDTRISENVTIEMYVCIRPCHSGCLCPWNSLCLSPFIRPSYLAIGLKGLIMNVSPLKLDAMTRHSKVLFQYSTYSTIA